MMYTFHKCFKCSNLESVPYDVGYVCPATGREFDRKETITAICKAIGIEKAYFLLMAITEDDVPEEKREVFYALREPLKKLFEKEE